MCILKTYAVRFTRLQTLKAKQTLTFKASERERTLACACFPTRTLGTRGVKDPTLQKTRQITVLGLPGAIEPA